MASQDIKIELSKKVIPIAFNSEDWTSADAEGETDSVYSRGKSAQPSVVIDPKTGEKYEILGIRYEDVDSEYYYVLYKDVQPGQPIGGWVPIDDVSISAVADWESLKR